MRNAPLRSRARRCVLRWRLTFSSRFFIRLMRSPIMRRSSSICASPGPPRVPMPPRWRSRWLQRRTSRVDRYCSRASSTCSLPSWLCARCAEDLEDQHRAVGHRRRRGAARGCAAAPATAPGRRAPPRRWCRCDQRLDLVGLARADEQRRVGRLAPADHARHGDVAGRLGEQRQLVERGVEVRPRAEVDADQDRPRGRRAGRCRSRSAAHGDAACGGEPRGSSGSASARAFGGVEVDARPGTTVEIACL